jgi:HK97 family phage major capsid protein
MPLSNEELLLKAESNTSQLGHFGAAGANDGLAPLSLEQADEFIRLMTVGQSMLKDVKVVTNPANKWEQPIIEFSGRITKNNAQHANLEGERLTNAERSKPSTGKLILSSHLLRAEVPITDEVFEDVAARADFRESLTALIADRVGNDIEDLLLNGDTAHPTDTYLTQMDGWIKQAKTAGSGAGNATVHVYNASADGQDYQAIFRRLLIDMPDRFKRNLESDGRFYVPQRLVEKYRDQLSARGTAMGDMMLTQGGELKYQGILIKPVVTLATTAGSPDTSHVLLTNRNNLFAGFRRQVTFETWRDPREGVTSFIVSARVDGKVAIRDACSVATNVDIEP